MSKMKNQKFFDIALAVGGSHYPGVGGELLEKFGEMVVRECAKSCTLQGDEDDMFRKFGIKQHTGTEE